MPALFLCLSHIQQNFRYGNTKCTRNAFIHNVLCVFVCKMYREYKLGRKFSEFECVGCGNCLDLWVSRPFPLTISIFAFVYCYFFSFLFCSFFRQYIWYDLAPFKDLLLSSCWFLSCTKWTHTNTDTHTKFLIIFSSRAFSAVLNIFCIVSYCFSAANLNINYPFCVSANW